MQHSRDEQKKNIYRSRQLQIIGLSLIILFFVLGYAVDTKVLNVVDIQFFILVNSAHNSVLDPVMVFLSLYGREVVWGGLGVGLFLFGGERKKKAAMTFGLIVLVLMGVGMASKYFYDRPRPYDTISGVRLLVGRESDASFPSGHTLIVAGGAVVAWLNLKRRWAAILTFEAALVSYSRIYVGVHFPTDVLGGALLGAGCAFIVCSDTRIIDGIYSRLPAILRAK